MTPEDRVREFWEQRGTPLSVASITELVRVAENDALERAAKLAECQGGAMGDRIRAMKHKTVSS